MQVNETTLNVTLPQVFFKHFASKNQLPGFYVSGTLAENGLISNSMSNHFVESQKGKKL